MRCFIPLTVADLAADSPVGFSVGARVFAGTPALAAATGVEDEEELDHLALVTAGDYSALAVSIGPARRVVVAADAELEAAENPELPSELRLAARLRWGDVVAIFLDDADAECDVRAAGEDQDALDRLEDYELSWYDISERGRVVADLIG